jgi:hypothetical protein
MDAKHLGQHGQEGDVALVAGLDLPAESISGRLAVRGCPLGETRRVRRWRTHFSAWPAWNWEARHTGRCSKKRSRWPVKDATNGNL